MQKMQKSCFALFCISFIFSFPTLPSRPRFFTSHRPIQNPYETNIKYESMRTLFRSKQRNKRSQRHHENKEPFFFPRRRTIAFQNLRIQKIHALKESRNFLILKPFPPPPPQSIKSKNSNFF